MVLLWVTRSRYNICIGTLIFLVALIVFVRQSYQDSLLRHEPSASLKHADESLKPFSFSTTTTPAPVATTTSAPLATTAAIQEPSRPRPVYKVASARPLAHRPFVAVKETFPLAALANSSADLPPVPSWNKPPEHHVPESTPVFIGFTRNWLMLQQTVVSLITAGWPPEDIYVVENTGVMDANQKGELTLQNPFFLDHHRLVNVLGVNVLVTPSLQTFAQLQNFYLSEALRQHWLHYFWAHMDVVMQSGEMKEPFQSFYMRCVEALRWTDRDRRWGLRFFAYDWFTLMNVGAMVELGGWDTMIPYYTADCDLYERMRMANMSTDAVAAGLIYDSPESMEDLVVFYRRKPAENGTHFVEDERGSEIWNATQSHLGRMAHVKNSAVRNRWQWQQMGGQGEPYYRDMDGFAEALEYTVQAGVQTWEAKWGITGCALVSKGLQLGDEWMVDRVEERDTPELEEPGFGSLG